MFSIETIDDVKILKELTNDTRINELEIEIQELTKKNRELLDITEKQNNTIDKLLKSVVTADQCKDIVFDMLNGVTKKDVIKRKAKRTIGIPKPDTDEFSFTKAMSTKFNEILVDGNTLIHHTVKNQMMKLPISTIELLALVEIYQHRERKLLNKDYKNICKLYNINKVQFGKLYYNLKEGTFFNTLNEIDNQIKRTNFKFKNGTVHIMNGSNLIDTKVSSKTFNYLLNVYINSNQPYSAIYKLCKEKHQLDPIHILTMLRRHSSVSKAIIEAR